MLKRLIIIFFQFLLIAGYLLFQVEGSSNHSLTGLGQIAFIYQLFLVFAFPFLFAKVVWQKRFFSLQSALSFLVYPILLLLIFILAQLKFLNWQDLAAAVIFALVLSTNVLFTRWLLSLTREALSYYLKTYSLLLIPAGLYILAFLLTRDQNSVLSLDVIQHQSVFTKMFANNTVCILPSYCSNLFLQDGYTTFYHSFLFFLTRGSGITNAEVLYYLDLVFGLFSLILIYGFTLQTFIQKFWSILTVCCALLVFNYGAYTFNFLIPQTFCFFLFLILLNARLSWKQLIIGALFLILTHFVVGAVLAVFLVIAWVFKNFSLEKFSLEIRYYVITISLVITLFIGLINYGGFSIERSLQQDATKYLGSVSNLYYPDNLIFLFEIFGLLTILLLGAIIYIVRKQIDNTNLQLAILFTSLGLTIFFLGPTYANKFLIGLGIWGTVLIIFVIKQFNLTIGKGILVALLIIITFLWNYQTTIRPLSLFFEQDTGISSAMVSEDQEIINDLNSNKKNCLIISDPFTQLMVAAYTPNQTAAGHYMSIQSRKALYQFVKNPSSDTLTALKQMPEVGKEQNLCFLYTSRLEKDIQEKNYDVTLGVYNYTIENSYPLPTEVPAIKYLQSQGKRVVFQSPHFILVQL